MKKLSVGLLTVMAALLVVACMSQKAPAEQAVSSAESALAGLRDGAQKYAPDQLQAMDASIAQMKDNLAKGNYKAVVDAVPAFNNGLKSLKETVDQKTQEAAEAIAKAKDAWDPMTKDVPKMVDAIQSRVDILSKSHHLPKGVTKDSLAAAKSGLDSMKQAWTDASNAAKSGDYPGAMTKGQAVKDQAPALMKSLGMSSG